jgi:signal transduction histidine kinase
MFELLYPSFSDKNIQIKHNTLISYAIYLLIQSFFTGYTTYNINGSNSFFVITLVLSICIPLLIIKYARKQYSFFSNLFIVIIWLTAAIILLIVKGDNSVLAFVLADFFVISALAALAIRWHIGIMYGLASIIVALIDLIFERNAILNFIYLPPIPPIMYFIGLGIMMGTMLVLSITYAISFERIYSAYQLELSSRKEIEDLLIKQNIELDEKVKERTSEVNTRRKELKAIYEELLASNEDLMNQKEELKLTIQSLQQTKQQLVHSEKMASLGILTAGIAHEINNPLNFINGGICNIESYINDSIPEHSKEIFPFIEAVNSGVNRAVNIVKSLNRFGHQTESMNESCDLHLIIEDCLIMIGCEIKDRIQIQKNYNKSPIIILGNEGKLNQIILNILTNAAQAIYEEGVIRIATSLSNDIAVITVNDSGRGINEGIINNVFDPFFTTKETGKGTGLGLYICYQIIQEFKGKIEIESKEEKGTTVTISLPIIKSLI